VSSDWSGGASDYVTVNFRATPFREFDAGSVRWSGTDPYTTEVVSSVGLGGAGTYGPFTLGSGHILHLYEVQLPAGMVSIRLDNLGGNVDWGMTLHPAFVPYDAKLTALAGGVAATGGPGQGERVTTVVPAPGWYAIAVWKSGPGDLPQSGTYRLVVNPNPTDALAMAPLPTQTALSSVHPNPFNPSTTIQFDVAEPGQVELEIYTLGGRRLRTLYTGTAPAGRHEARWDGTDDAGRRAASGIYFVRLRTAATSDQRKLVMLK
jgi:flagellar hook capping protein FlgD